MANHKPRRRLPTPGKDMVKIAVEAGVAIGPGDLADAPRFTYTPGERPWVNGPPSARGSYSYRKRPGLEGVTFTPVPISLNPAYCLPMVGDPPALTRAREAWSKGDAGPLIKYLEKGGRGHVEQ